MRFQRDGARRGRRRSRRSMSTSWSTTSLAIVLATCVPKTRNAMKLKTAAHEHREAGREHPRRHDGGDRVGGVVEAVDEVEAERDDDRRRPERRVLHGRSGVLQDDALDDVGDVLDRVHDCSRASTMSFHLQHVERVELAARRGGRRSGGRRGRPRSRAGRSRRAGARSPSVVGSLAISATFASAAFARAGRPGRASRAAA